MEERTLLAAAIQERKAFEQLDDNDAIKEFSDQGKIIYKQVKDYYERDDSAQSADSGILLERLLRAHPLEKHQNIFTTISHN